MADESEVVYLPGSTPWNAPELHHRGFELPQAKKTDIYSFGMLCLWVLFKDDLPYAKTLIETREKADLGSFDGGLTEADMVIALEKLKKQDKMGDLVGELVEGCALCDEEKVSLKEAFRKILSHDPGERISDLREWLEYLKLDRYDCFSIHKSAFAESSTKRNQAIRNTLVPATD